MSIMDGAGVDVAAPAAASADGVLATGSSPHPAADRARPAAPGRGRGRRRTPRARPGQPTGPPAPHHTPAVGAATHGAETPPPAPKGPGPARGGKTPPGAGAAPGPRNPRRHSNVASEPT